MNHLILLILLTLSFNGMSQTDSLLLTSSENYTIYEVSNVKKSLIFVDSTNNLTGVLLEERLDQNGFVKRSTVITKVIDVKIKRNLIGVLYAKDLVLIYALYEVNDTSELVNLSMISSPSGRDLTKYELLDAITVYKESLIDPLASGILRFTPDGKINLFNSDSGIQENSFFKNLKSTEIKEN